MKVLKDKLYTTAEVAKYLNVSITTVKRYISNNSLASLKFNGLRRIRGIELIKITEKKL